MSIVKFMILFLMVELSVATDSDTYLSNVIATELNSTEVSQCISNCELYVSLAFLSCGALCKQNTGQFNNLMTSASKRLKQQICGVNLASVSFGNININLPINSYNGNCVLGGNFAASIKFLKSQTTDSTAVSTHPHYILTTPVDINWSGVSVTCSPATQQTQPNNPPAFSGAVQVHQTLSMAQTFNLLGDQVNPQTGQLGKPFYTESNLSSTSVTTTLAASIPPAYSVAIQNAISGLFTGEQTLAALDNYIFECYATLLGECVGPACYTCDN